MKHLVHVTNAPSEIEPFMAILPEGYVYAQTLGGERVNADELASFAYGACPICGHVEHRGGEYRQTNENDGKHKRVYCLHCLALERFSRAHIRRIVDCKPQKCNKRLSFVCEVNPDEGADNAALAAALLTPSRNTSAATVGRWYRKNDNGYSSTQMNANLKELNTRMDSVFEHCKAGVITLDILVDYVHVETLVFTFGEERLRKGGRFVSKKDVLMTEIDWEVGKYRKEGRGLYHHKENAARAKVERSGMNWRRFFK